MSTSCKITLFEFSLQHSSYEMVNSMLNCLIGFKQAHLNNSLWKHSMEHVSIKNFKVLSFAFTVTKSCFEPEDLKSNGFMYAVFSKQKHKHEFAMASFIKKRYRFVGMKQQNRRSFHLQIERSILNFCGTIHPFTFKFYARKQMLWDW